MSAVDAALRALQRDPLSHVDMLEPLRRGAAEVLAAGARGVLLRERESGAYMLSAQDEAAGAELIARIPACELAAAHQDFLVEPLAARFDFTERMHCLQAVYASRTRPRLQGPLDVRPLGPERLPFVLAHYAKPDEAELRRVMRAGLLFGGFLAGRLVGFVGLHLEGSMGMLEVLPEWRRRGFGAQLEAHLIDWLLRRGRVPYAQIVEGNEKSLGLQKKLGLTLAPGRVCWLMR